ncbi:MAG: hypothetical protein ABW321_03080 [Polyangiales bacterium]
MKALLPCGLFAFGLASMSGCVVAVDDDRNGGRRGDAYFTVEWEIDRSQNPDRCIEYSVDYAFVTVNSRDGFVTDRSVPCEEFGTEFTVPPGSYWASVVLVDRFDDDRTETAETDDRPFLYDGDSDYVVLNFPDDSFFF